MGEDSISTNNFLSVSKEQNIHLEANSLDQGQCYLIFFLSSQNYQVEADISAGNDQKMYSFNQIGCQYVERWIFHIFSLKCASFYHLKHPTWHKAAPEYAERHKMQTTHAPSYEQDRPRAHHLPCSYFIQKCAKRQLKHKKPNRIIV